MKTINFYKGTELKYSVYANSLEEVQEKPINYFKEYTEDMKITDKVFQNPILKDGELREMTRDEMVENGISINLEDGEFIENKKLIKVEKPSIYHKWNGKEWIVNIEELKENKREELKRIRTDKLYENININGNEFQVRQGDLDNFWDIDYMIKNNSIQLTDKRNWILADNTIKEFSYAELLQILNEFIKRKAIIFEKFGILSYKLTQANAINDIELIDWK